MMADKRKSFIIHKDSLAVLDDLTDEQAGKLFRAIKSFHEGEEVNLDSLLKIAFSPFKNQFIRDNEKYQATCEKRAAAGKAGGKAKASNLANASKDKQDLANLADSDSKNKSKNESDSDNKSESKNKAPVSANANQSFEIFRYWCDVMGKNLNQTKLTPKRDKAIKARLKDGYTLEQIKQAIDGCRMDPFSMGQNDRHKAFNDIELICRTGEKLESFFNNQPQSQQFSQATQATINNLLDTELD